jgi:hypothetical protein
MCIYMCLMLKRNLMIWFGLWILLLWWTLLLI